MTLAEAKKGVSADGDPKTNSVRFYDTFFSDTSNGRGNVIFHELLHVLLNTDRIRGSHIEVAKKLGLDFTESPLGASPLSFKSPMLRDAEQERERGKLIAEDDVRAQGVITTFINKGCLK